jgi:hypothetical protein
VAALFVGAVMENIFEYAPIIYMDKKEPIKIKKLAIEFMKKTEKKATLLIEALISRITKELLKS